MKSWGRLLALVVLVVAIAAVIYHRESFDPAAVEAWVAAQGLWAPLLFMALYAIGAVLFLPGSVLTLAGGALFGPWLGTLYSLTGATVGATLAFLVARHLVADWVRARTGPRMEQLVGGVEQEGWRFVAFTRLVPLFPFNLLNYALGLTRIPLWHYILATWICMLPGAFAYTWLGFAGREAIAGGEGVIQKGLLALALLALVAFLPRLIQRWRSGAIRSLTIPELRARLASADPPRLLDVRDADEYAAAHIAGACHIPLGELPHRLEELAAWRDSEIAVICRTDRRSAKAVARLRAAGFAMPVLVREGMERWQREGLPVETP